MHKWVFGFSPYLKHYRVGNVCIKNFCTTPNLTYLTAVYRTNKRRLLPLKVLRLLKKITNLGELILVKPQQ